MDRIESLSQLVPLHCAYFACGEGHPHIHLLFGTLSAVPPQEGETDVFMNEDGEVFRSSSEYLLNLS